MTPYKQLFRHNPAEGVYGDCARTAVACLIDVHPSEIPHEHRQHADGEQRALIESWLRPRGYAIGFLGMPCDPEHMMQVMKVSNPGMYYMLSGTSRTGVAHVVICKDDEIVWDPSLDDAGIIGRCPDDLTYIEFLCTSRVVEGSEQDRPASEAHKEGRE